MKANRFKENNCSNCNNRSCAASVLSNSELEKLSLNHYECTYASGELILHENSQTSHIIYLKSGLSKEYLNAENNTENILQIIKPHTYLGLHSLFGDKVNNYSYKSLSEVEVCYIDLTIFLEFVKNNGNFAFEILNSVCSNSLSNYYRFMSQRKKKIYGKVADLLLYFSEAIFEDFEFIFPMKRSEIASLIGSSRENVTKQLNQFHADKIIELKGREVKIIDRSKLKLISKNG